MSSNHLCTTYSPYIHSSIFIIYFHHLFTIYSLYIHLFIYLFITYSPYIHHLSNHLFIIYPFIYSVAGSSQAEFYGATSELMTDIKRAQWNDNALLSLADDELGSINHSIIITRGKTDSWSRTLENWTSILSHLHHEMVPKMMCVQQHTYYYLKHQETTDPTLRPRWTGSYHSVDTRSDALSAQI